jgi:hypothetical protein
MVFLQLSTEVQGSPGIVFAPIPLLLDSVVGINPYYFSESSGALFQFGVLGILTVLVEPALDVGHQTLCCCVVKGGRTTPV